jgi:predicted DNA-binding transcriptional regulator YafY
VRSSGNSGFEEALQSAVAKIAGSLGDTVSVDLNALRDSTTYSFSPAARVDAEITIQLHRAGASRQKVKIPNYTASRGEWSERVVHPYHLFFARGDWILIAFDENKSALRCFNIARISRLDARQDHFERQGDFDAAAYVRAMFFAEAGDEVFQVAVRFDEYQARYIGERTWHPDQKFESLPDGGAILRFPASGLNETARFVLGYGRHAQVLEPPQLRELVQFHLRDMMEMYGSDTLANSQAETLPSET